MADASLDLRERVLEYAQAESFEEVIRLAVQAHTRNLWTAMPVSLVEDSDGKTAKLQATIKVPVRDAEGKVTHQQLPELHDVPIHFQSGGGTTTTFPVKKGDEGIVLFMSRSVDAWFQSGGVQKAVDTRSHHLSDGIYIPGVRSQPRELKDINTEATETRSDDGKHKVVLHPKKGVTVSVENGKHTVTLTPDDGIKLLADAGKHVMTLHPKNGIGIETAIKLAMKATQGLDLTGNLKVAGDVKATGTIGAPSLAGLLGAFLGSIAGFLMCLGTLMALSAASGAPSPVLQASYVLASVWSR